MILLLLACTASSPTTLDTGAAPDTADSAGGDSADTGTGGDSADTALDPADVDDDGDGFTPNAGDCDDTRPKVYPGAPWSWWIQSGELNVCGTTPAEVTGDGSVDLIAGTDSGAAFITSPTAADTVAESAPRSLPPTEELV